MSTAIPKVNGYYPTIGIETHVQLKTKTKLFAGIDNDARSAEPNTLISHICVGMPGSLPVLNEKAVEHSIRAALALKTKPSHYSKFDRKHYFYPDLPKGYQITQFDQPIVIGGSVGINVDGSEKNIGITRAHLEEDAGKSTHPAGSDYSLVDLNRAGTPLLEIVSEPDIHTPAEAKAYTKELYLLMRYADVSEANLFYGNMRFDVNVSVSKDPKVLGTRSETKNLNSFKSVEKTVEYEIKRQIELLNKGGKVVQETRGFDDAKQKTFSQRTKEDSHDYRYFPEPDIPPVLIKPETVEAIKKQMPVLPDELRGNLKHLNLDSSVIETIIEHIPAGKFMTKILLGKDDQASKRIALWLAGDVQALVAGGITDWDSLDLKMEDWLALVKLVEDGELSATNAKKVVEKLVVGGGDPRVIAKEENLLQVSDQGEIEKIVQSVITANPKAADDVRSGEMKAIGFLVGQIMKESGGKANPGLVQEMIKTELGV
jgi:aspartyl-tRNA(Asn)/glutamyl-tRNA(Gln) amidotransferase subunit B